MTFDEQSYLDLYPDSKDRLVYLSADSPNVIDNIEDDKIYIIGGIVDKNRHKLLCYNRAEQQGIAHGRLKIDTYIRMKGRPILTVDQVLEIISKYLECRDWEAAFFAVIPKRKELTSKKELAPKDSSKGDEGESDGSSDSDAEEVRGTLRGQSAGTYTG
jgi:tRNA (guanine9-N1)-methyltransferase